MKSIKIVFWGFGITNWEGGIQFLCNIIKSYCVATELWNKKYEMSVILDKANKLNSYIVARCEEISEHIIFFEALNVKEAKAFVKSDIQADIIIPVHCGVIRGISIPYVSYIPDIQEEYLSSLFSKKDILQRRKINKYCFARSKKILLTSNNVLVNVKDKYNDAVKDVEFFCQPCAPLSDEKYWENNISVLKKYGIDGRYFLISNQFWQHKNHIIAFKAIRKIVKENDKAVLVCTGDTDDYRNREYIVLLKTFIEQNNLENNIKILGYIDKEDQINLLKNADAVIQPTLFEGGAGGFAAQEAVAYSRPLLLSDIDINRELVGYNNIDFFSPEDETELSEKMKKILGVPHVEYDIEVVKKIYFENATKLAKFYCELTDTVLLNSGL